MSDRRIMTIEEARSICKDYNAGMPTATLRLKYKRGYDTIRKAILRAGGVIKNTRSGWAPPCKSKWGEVRRLSAEGLSVGEIAIRLCIYPKEVQWVLDGCPPPKEKTPVRVRRAEQRRQVLDQMPDGPDKTKLLYILAWDDDDMSLVEGLPSAPIAYNEEVVYQALRQIGYGPSLARRRSRCPEQFKKNPRPFTHKTERPRRRALCRTGWGDLPNTKELNEAFVRFASKKGWPYER